MRQLLVFILISLFWTVGSAQRTPTSTASLPKTQPASVAPSTESGKGQTQTRVNQPNSKTSATDRSGTSTGSKKTSRGVNPYPAPEVAPAQTTPNTQANSRSTNAGSTTNQAKNTPSTTTGKNTPAAGEATKLPAPEVAKPVKVNWLTLEEALEKSKTEKRKIFIDVYTDWCGWCKRMDQTTFSDPSVVAYLNEKYYAVKFNAEQAQDIVFKNKTYRFKKVGNRGYHELAAEWLNNRMSYPTTVFLNEDLDVIQPLPGYLDAPRFEAIINYFGTDNHKKTPWETYEKNFVSGKQR